MTLLAIIERVEGALRNRWRKCKRSPFIGDLRIIKLEYRHIYRKRMASGDLGWALNALWNAYYDGHLRSQNGVRPNGNARPAPQQVTHNAY